MNIDNSHFGTKDGRFFSTFVFVILFVLVCGSYETYNSPFYESSYYDGGDPSDEWLFLFLERLGSSLDIDFKYFVFILYAVGLLLLRKTISRLVGGKAWVVYLLFCIFPLAEVRSAIRNSMAMFLLVYSFPFLLSNDIKDLIKYIVVIIIATGFHRVSAVYFLLVLLPIYRNSSSIHFRRFLSTLTTLLILSSFFICLSPSLISYLQPLLVSLTTESDLVREGQSIYFESIAGWGFILFALYQVSWILVFRYFKSKEWHVDDYPLLSTYIDIVSLADIFMLVFVFAYKFDSNFFRLFMNLVPLNYIGLVWIGRLLKRMPLKTAPIIWGALIYILVFGIRQTAIFFDANIVTMFSENWLIHLKL